MRRGLFIAALLASCAKSAPVEIEVPAGTETIVYVVFGPNGGDPIDVRATPAARFFARGEVIGETTAALFYPRLVEDLGLMVSDGVVDWTDDGTPDDSGPLPAPASWIEITDGQVAPGSGDFDARFARVRLPRIGCPSLGAFAALRLPEGVGRTRFLVPVGEDGAVGGSTFLDEETTRLFRVSAGGVELLDGVTPFVAVGGFGVADGRAWVLTYTSTTAPVPVICEVHPSAPMVVTPCTPMTFEGPPPLFRPIQMAAQVHEGRVLAASMDNDGALWLGGPDTPWKKLAEPEPVAGCEIGIQTLALDFDGPGTGIAAFKDGPILRFSTDTSTTTAFFDPLGLLPHCRSAWGRFESGAELLVLERDRTTAEREIWWRPAPSTEWSTLPHADAIEAKSIRAVGPYLMVSGGVDQMRFFAHDPPSELRLCMRSFGVGSTGHHVAVLPDRIFFSSASDRQTSITAMMRQ